MTAAALCTKSEPSEDALDDTRQWDSACCVAEPLCVVRLKELCSRVDTARVTTDFRTNERSRI